MLKPRRIAIRYPDKLKYSQVSKKLNSLYHLTLPADIGRLA